MSLKLTLTETLGHQLQDVRRKLPWIWLAFAATFICVSAVFLLLAHHMIVMHATFCE